ncbi:MAG: hypothetical protein M1445_02675 [Bacteroidetes bacterium]|nr:hypothetical protein [Bacteroidota bacterium]MCL6101183.1 hypothetical protein [Bacteroidota bacterium]
MKNILSWLIGLAIILGAIYFCSDNKKIKEPIKNTNRKDTYFEDFIWRDYNRIIGLLSVKYHINESVVKGIAIEYLRINQPSDYTLLTEDWEYKDTSAFENIPKPKETIRLTLDRLSKYYGLKKDSLDLLLLDFEIWNTAREKHE